VLGGPSNEEKAMNIGKLTAIAALAAGIGATAPALASLLDETGLNSLGIDISHVGAGPESAQQFIAGLAPDTQRAVLNGCQTAVTFPVSYPHEVRVFCQDAIGAGAPAGALGFMQEPASVVAPMPDFAPTIPEAAY
jgi:hypothetical protein